ncbi:MAG: hypothetical protein ABJF50_06735 [Paracoccaceae bacterium]
MKTHYLKTIGGFPPIRIAVPALRIRGKRPEPIQRTSHKRDELMSVFRQDLAAMIDQRHGRRVCSRALKV